jgi:hypothetical protein
MSFLWNGFSAWIIKICRPVITLIQFEQKAYELPLDMKVQIGLTLVPIFS